MFLNILVSYSVFNYILDNAIGTFFMKNVFCSFRIDCFDKSVKISIFICPSICFLLYGQCLCWIRLKSDHRFPCFKLFIFLQVCVQMGRWNHHKETHGGLCSKICRVSNGLDWSSAWQWVHFPLKVGYVVEFYPLDNFSMIKNHVLTSLLFAAGAPFPPNFMDVVKTILKRPFRVYAHIYHSHFRT